MPKISIGHKLYISVMAVFLIFAISFIVFQQTREKQYKISTLDMKLQDYNQRLHEALIYEGNMHENTIARYVKTHPEKYLRVTLIDVHGHVFFDNMRKDYHHISNHSTRTEFIQAVRNGHGATVDRNSTTMKHDYFYSATYFPHERYIIRTALPYNTDLAKSLQADQHYIWFAVGAIILLTLLLYRFVNRLGKNIINLRKFAWRADHNESLDTDDLVDFPDDELGEIAERIIKMYRRLKSTRKEQDVLKRQLTQNIAHELKTPVASIQGYLETIIDHPDMNEGTKQQFLMRCHVQSERLTALLQDISTLNKMDDSNHNIEFESVDIIQLISQIQKETALQLEQRKMQFVQHFTKPVIIHGNRSLLYSIFRNLTDNAIFYAGEGTTINIDGELADGEYQFTFCDNGIGVPHEHLQRIFERFYRVDKGRSRKTGGTGLGLAIVKNAVLLHGGKIKASNLPNGGLNFEFTLKINCNAH